MFILHNHYFLLFFNLVSTALHILSCCSSSVLNGTWSSWRRWLLIQLKSLWRHVTGNYITWSTHTSRSVVLTCDKYIRTRLSTLRSYAYNSLSEDTYANEWFQRFLFTSMHQISNVVTSTTSKSRFFHSYTICRFVNERPSLSLRGNRSFRGA